MKRTNWKPIKHDFETSHIKLKDLAKKYHIKVGTLRSHKSRNHWSRDDKSSHKSVATQHKKSATLHNDDATKLTVQELNQSGLTDKQQNFCFLYLKYYNATKAYHLAYKAKYNSSAVLGWRLLNNVKIQKELNRLRQKQVNHLYIDQSDVIRRLIMMFFADIGDYIHFGHKQRTDLDTGEKYQQSYVYLKNQSDVDTTPVSEIHIGQNGTEVKLPDKVQLGKLLIQKLPAPINHDLRKDTLVSAFQNFLRKSADDDKNSKKDGKN